MSISVLDPALAFHASPLAANVALDLEHARRLVELLTDIFADALQLAPAMADRIVLLVANLHMMSPDSLGLELIVFHRECASSAVQDSIG